MIAPNKHINTIIRPISTPSRPKIMGCNPLP
jgi:hypothetical protein